MKYLNLFIITSTLISCRMQAPDAEYKKLVTVSSGENKSFTTYQEQSVEIEYQHNFDAENISPEIAIIKKPNNGSLADCKVSDDFKLSCMYVPNIGFSGNDTFTLSGKDGQFYSKQYSIISITVKKRGPSLAKINSQTVNENSKIANIDANDNGSDLDSNGIAIKYSCFINNNKVRVGKCANVEGISFNEVNGVMNWTPNFSQAGLYGFEINADSDGRNESQFFDIKVSNVNRAPALNSVANYYLELNQNMGNIDINDADDDYDIDNEKILYTCLVNSKNCIDEKGLSFNTSTGLLSFDNAKLVLSNYNFNIIGSDGNLTDSVSFKVSIARNQPPVIGQNQNITILRDTKSTFVVNPASDDYTDTSKLQYEISQNPSNGQVSNCFTINGSALECSYLPNFKYIGVDSFTYKVFDGEFYSNESKIVFTIKDRGPKIDPITDQTITEEESISSIDINDSGDDKDQNNNNITYECSFNKSNSSSKCSDLEGLSFNSTNGKLDWRTNIDQGGTYNFVITANSDNLSDKSTFTIVVKEKNRAPIINKIADISISRGDSTNLIDFNDGDDDKDIDGDQLTYFCLRNGIDCSLNNDVTFNSSIGTFQFDSTNSVAEVEKIQITSTDGSLSATTTFSIYVSANNAPIVGDNQTESLYVNTSITLEVNKASDDISPLANLTYEIVDYPLHGQLSNCLLSVGLRACTYTPDVDFIGNDSFSYQVRDESNLVSGKATVFLIVAKDTLYAVEDFEQKEEDKLKGVDIVWVIDDSGSMADEQQTLATNFGSFIDNFVDNNKIPDFQMAITTTDARQKQENFIADESGKQWELNSTAQANDKIKFSNDFKTAVNVGIKGSGSEKSIDSASYIYSKHPSWFRGNDYLLVYILLTDEVEQSSMTTLENTNLLKSFKDNGEKVKVYPIINKSVDTQRFDEIAAQTGGKVYDLYSSFSNVLGDLSTSIIEKLSSFMLKSEREIVENTVSVSINDKIIASKDANNNIVWKYENNSIFFTTPPEQGAKIKVMYEYKIR